MELVITRKYKHFLCDGVYRLFAYQPIRCCSPLISLFAEAESSPFASLTPDKDVRWSCERGAAYFHASASNNFSSLRRDSKSSSIKARCVSNLPSWVKVRSSARWAKRLSSATCWREEERAGTDVEEADKEIERPTTPAADADAGDAGILTPPPPAEPPGFITLSLSLSPLNFHVSFHNK
eukprot:c20030_g1_i2 orf=1-537(-)